MRGNSHVRFGGRRRGNHRPKGRNRRLAADPSTTAGVGTRRSGCSRRWSSRTELSGPPVRVSPLRGSHPSPRSITSQRAERDAIEAEIDDAAACLKLVETLEAFMGRLTHRLNEMDTDEQARILQLLVRDVLIGGEDETVTIRHSIPLPSGGENPGLRLHTVRHGVPSCRPSPASVFSNREGTPPSSSGPSTTFG
jgi:hypothetical protein